MTIMYFVYLCQIRPEIKLTVIHVYVYVADIEPGSIVISYLEHLRSFASSTNMDDEVRFNRLATSPDFPCRSSTAHTHSGKIWL